MAYALRLKIECSSITGDNAEILVYKEGYTGEAVTRAGGETPFQLKWGDGSKEMLPIVYGSQLTAAFILQTDFEFTDLFVTNARDIYIEIIVNETDKIWCGFIDPGNYTEQLIAPQFEVSFDAFDGLGLLKDEDFLDDDKTPYTGEYTLLALLQLILSKTGLSLPLNTRINFRPTEMSSAADMLTQVTKDVVTYTDMSCYEVLESIFKNCRIFQRGGEWYILSNDVWAQSSITCYAYTAAGAANGTKVISPALDGWYIIDIGKMDMLPPLKQIKFSQDYGYKNNLLENSDFAEIDESGNFDAWTPVNIIPQQRVYDAEGNKYVYLPGVERLDPWQTANRTKYLQSDPLTVAAASDMFKISLGYALMGPKNNSAYIFFGMFLAGDNGTDYALEAYYYTETDLREVRYRWTASTHKLAVPVAAHIKRSKVFLGPDTFTVEPDRIEAWPYDEVINNFKTAEITVEGGIPTSGIVTVYLFAAHTGGTVAGSCFRQIKLMLIDETENEYTTSVANVLINNLRNNLVPDDLEFVNGDTPDIANRLTIYQGGFLLNDGSGEGTRLWKHDSSVNTFTFAELMTRFIGSEIRTAKQKYDLKLGNSNLGDVLVLTDADNDNRKFVESGITYTFHRAEIEGQFIELTDLNLTDYSVVILKEEIATGNKSSSKNPALMADFDERAALIDPNDYNIEGQPGYFNSDDFEQIIDENTGRASTSFTWKLVTQTAHGLSAGNAIRHNGTTWVKAIADSTANLTTAIVRKVIDVDTFVYQSDGFYPDATFTPGTWNYLSGVTAGLVVTTPDAETVQCLGFVTDRGWKIEIDNATINGVDAYVYVAYASDAAGTGFSLIPTDLLKYRAEIHTTSPLTPPVASDFASAVWVKYLGEDGADGAPGADGEDGAPGADGTDGLDAYVYVAYASDNAGTGFSLTPTDLLKYRAEIHVTAPLTPPVAGDFAAAVWVKYLGDDGEDGAPGAPGAPGADGEDGAPGVGVPAGGTTGQVLKKQSNTDYDTVWADESGGTDNNFDVYIDFLDTTAFTYNCPAALKFTQVISESTAPTLSVALDTNMAQFDKLTVTPAAVGLVILKGVLL